MFFASTLPVNVRRPAYNQSGRSLERFLDETLLASRQRAASITQDEQSFTLSFDVPGIAREQLSIGIEDNVVRIESREGAPRQYKAAYELPQDIDAGTSEARLALGVLTLKLAKKVPVSRVTELTIN